MWTCSSVLWMCAVTLTGNNWREKRIHFLMFPCLQWTFWTGLYWVHVFSSQKKKAWDFVFIFRWFFILFFCYTSSIGCDSTWLSVPWAYACFQMCTKAQTGNITIPTKGNEHYKQCEWHKKTKNADTVWDRCRPVDFDIYIFNISLRNVAL